MDGFVRKGKGKAARREGREKTRDDDDDENNDARTGHDEI